MSNRVCLITGIGGLIGSQCAEYFKDKFDLIVGIDNDSRKEFFGENASVESTIDHMYNLGCDMWDCDITSRENINEIFSEFGRDINLIIHTAAQPSHDYAADHAHRDFEVNALGTLNLLEAYRKYCPEAVFIFTSTNKVYGDSPNLGYFDELETRYEPAWYKHGYKVEITEKQSIDHITHSLFGVSKAAADLMVQEYGKYFGLKTGVFRGGCLTGTNHKSVPLHGFLSYIIKCGATNSHYDIFGTGKQVRDNIDAYDVAAAFEAFYNNPRPGEVYNLGGGRGNDISVLEVISEVNKLRLEEGLSEWVDYTIHPDKWRKGDHKWYVTDLNKLKSHYPEWQGVTIKINDIIRSIFNSYEHIN